MEMDVGNYWSGDPFNLFMNPPMGESKCGFLQGVLFSTYEQVGKSKFGVFRYYQCVSLATCNIFSIRLYYLTSSHTLWLQPTTLPHSQHHKATTIPTHSLHILLSPTSWRSPHIPFNSLLLDSFDGKNAVSLMFIFQHQIENLELEINVRV